MENLIKIDTNENQEPIVSGRELHGSLDIKTKYTEWLNRMLEYGFIENVDYIIIENKVQSQNRERTYLEIDHILKLDMAKEIAMIQRTEQGKQVRQYFIQVEKEFNSPEKIMARALRIADKEISSLKQITQEQTNQIEVMKPKVLFAEAITTSTQSILVGQLAKLLATNGIKNMGQNRLFEWLRGHDFLHKSGQQRNLPTQKSIELKIMEVKTTTINNPDGSIRVTKTTKVTGKGQIYFVNKFIK